LTGGPCSGKTTVQQALREEFHESVLLVPEVATLLLEGGFPNPGRHLPWTQQWQDLFQAAVLPLQRSIEESYALLAGHQGAHLLVCDRGLLDGASYIEGGVEAFCELHDLDRQEALGRYEAVLHLESLATAAPEHYGKENNACRFEPLEQAQKLEFATRRAWEGHPRHVVIAGRAGFRSKIDEVIEFVRALLAEV
jgi:predicted ATPase